MTTKKHVPTKEQLDEVIRILSEHCYSDDEIEEQDRFMPDDAFAFDHWCCVKLLTGEDPNSILKKLGWK